MIPLPPQWQLPLTTDNFCIDEKYTKRLYRLQPEIQRSNLFFDTNHIVDQYQLDLMPPLEKHSP